MSETARKNINRGYMKLRVWQDANAYYGLTCRLFLAFPRELAYKIENGLKRLIESLQLKRESGGWEDSFIARESNAACGEKP
ncbi:MAG: hypothetical protein QME60_03995 [Verrucomicrobiota bacterium]|nr:hypothetical protein [Verrucomicrobiota bacterium]